MKWWVLDEKKAIEEQSQEFNATHLSMKRWLRVEWGMNWLQWLCQLLPLIICGGCFLLRNTF